MATTIQISDNLRDLLSKRKMFQKETYEEVILDLLEDSMELSEQTLANIKEAEKDIEEGRVFTHDEIKKELGL
jgi:predicted transcriptional regulator